MGNTTTRQELYDWVWSKPGTHLAKEMGVSDIAISKACKRYDIPRPQMGYWAKVNAGKVVGRRPLPPRGPGMSDLIEIGGGRYVSQPFTKSVVIINVGHTFLGQKTRTEPNIYLPSL